METTPTLARPWGGLLSTESIEKGLLALFLLNLLDAVATLLWVEAGLATEANPVMAAALDSGPATFLGAKIAVVTLSMALLWRHRARLFPRIAAIPLCLLYAAVGGVHLGVAVWLGVLV